MVAQACGLRVESADVLNDSNRLALRLRPCDVLARVAPTSRRDGAAFEVEVARRLASTGAPLATLERRVDPRVYEEQGFVVTLWTYYEAVAPHDPAPAEYAQALAQLHAGMKQGDGLGERVPHVRERVEEARRLVADPGNDPGIGDADRELLVATLDSMPSAIFGRGAPEQLLHGEPHPGNVLRTSEGLRFVDLETCCRGPVEFDIAHASTTGAPPLDVAAHYPGADPSLVRDCRILVLAMFTAWRFEPGDDLPNGRALAVDWIRQLRSALGS